MDVCRESLRLQLIHGLSEFVEIDTRLERATEALVWPQVSEYP